MSVMKGLEACKCIRNSIRKKDMEIQVCELSGHNQNDCVPEGFHEWIEKPLNY